ncbi:YggT family protein [Vacuolonema iberomarrocanum]|uniref:YggT family protein n=1 Tax=Vacuolonema iberomarrocanum TaxID=3454632 RepID=UPI0019FB1D81|nr:YggT family protein [filamentous cyanobacterium LEGE 07170]
MSLFAQSLAAFLQIYFVLIIIRVLLSWFPTIDWYNQPFNALSQLVDPYLNLFRRIIPPIGGLDLSPILAIFALQLVSQLVASAAASTSSLPL